MSPIIPPSDASKSKIVIAAMIGHILEFFDFTIYAVFAGEIGKNFFPQESSFAQLLASLAVLAVGFFMRPLGGVLFGHIGDKKGRRFALTIAIVGMACATILMGLLPTYVHVGIWAPVMLVLLRLVQGLCVGGEGAGASIFVLEHLHQLRPGLIGGIVNAALTIGILLAITIGWILNSSFPNHPDLWRYAFCFGGILGVAGLYVRLSVDETPIFKALQARNKVLHSPLKSVLKSNPKAMMMTLCVGAVTGCAGYMVMTFTDLFYKAAMERPVLEALSFAVYGNLLLVVMLPLMGMLSDRCGYASTMFYGSLLAILTSVPIFMLMSSHIAIYNYAGISMLSTVAAMIYAPLYPFVIRLFKPEQRYSGIASSLNIGIALFGGTSSIICLKMIEISGLLYAPAFYLSGVCIIFILALLALQPNQIIRRSYQPKKVSPSIVSVIPYKQ
jgi:MHS family proline/betaine transporter-like MFS transporter